MSLQNFSLHTHSKGFDGKNTVEEMALAAQNVGFEKLGISNHFIVHPNIKDAKMYAYALRGEYHNIYSSTFDEAVEKFKPHYEEIDQISQKTGFKIYKGMEVDFFTYDGWRDGFEKACEILKPDYIIGSAHFICTGRTLYNTHDLKNTSKEEQNLLLHKYYQNLRAASQSGIFNFLAHLDLMKKVGLGSEDKWIEEERQTVEVISASNIAVEINTSAYNRGFDEPYPSKRILKMLAESKVPVIISDDAHNVERLGDRFETAQQIALNTGIQSFYNPFKKDLSPFFLNSRQKTF